MGHCSFSATASTGITRPVQSAHVRTGRAVSTIRSKTTAHSLVKKSSLSDAACLCRQIAMTGVAPAAWAIVLLVSPPPKGLPSQCNRHRCEREGQSLLFLQRPPPTHRSRRAPCQMRLSDFSSVQAAQVQTGRTVSATRSKTTAHPLVKKSSLPDAAVRLLESCSTHTFDLGAEAFDASSERVEALD